ncbi:MAG TPA: D-aminoacyl-tRNA deacylase [Abditibacteriaceae bacterium]|jgi:D-tyrosyl-tRNA(Tyr) deacylase
MKAVVQRCRSSRVEVGGKIVGEILHGFTVFLGVMDGDDETDARKLAQKIAGLRIFDNAEGKFDLSLRDVSGEVLLISNFTLAGDARKGNRPNFGAAARPAAARDLYEGFATLLRDAGFPVATGEFGAEMRVFVENDGPVTLVLDTKL